MNDIERVGRFLDFSQAAYVIAMAATVVFTLGIVIFGKRYTALKDEQFAAYKVRAEAETREHIAKVEAEAQKEIARVAGDSQMESARIETEAKKEIAAANERAGEATREAGKANAEAARLSAELVAAQRALEDEKLRRVELEKSMAPRLIPFVMMSGNKTNVDSLKPYAGTKVIVQCIPDFEARRAAANIAGLLDSAGWKIESLEIVDDNIEDGVSIQSYRAPTPDKSNPAKYTEQVMLNSGIERRSEFLARQLERFLLDANWQAEARMAMLVDGPLFPSDTIRIKVGFKPTPYDLNPQMQEMKQRMIQARKDSLEYEERRRREIDELLRRFPPPEPPKK